MTKRRRPKIDKTELAIRKARRQEALARLPEICATGARVKVRDPGGIHITVWVGATRVDWWPSTSRYLRSDQRKTSKSNLNEFVKMLTSIDPKAASDDFEVIE